MARQTDSNGVALEDIRNLKRIRAIVELKRCIRDLQYARSEDEQNMIVREMKKFLKAFKHSEAHRTPTLPDGIDGDRGTMYNAYDNREEVNHDG